MESPETELKRLTEQAQFSDIADWKLYERIEALGISLGVMCCSRPAVMFRSNPYASEINGDDTPRWQCDQCYTQSLEDI